MNYLHSQREGHIIRDLAVKYLGKRPLSPTQNQYTFVNPTDHTQDVSIEKIQVAH